ncbi:hypothetical protein IFM89_020017 [Coptis chinensis]|uniref:Uncharacterized protein n=1 Tax=Coptis chinensis TaxID=261450 RepID=A0A835ITK4_9MAGN|nr:hypothetical protein IFM89_020017 [Coptis chinensis]
MLEFICQNPSFHTPVYMPDHGRTSSADGLKILINHSGSEKLGYTKNIVYREIFNNLPTDSGSDAVA